MKLHQLFNHVYFQWSLPLCSWLLSVAPLLPFLPFHSSLSSLRSFWSRASDNWFSTRPSKTRSTRFSTPLTHPFLGAPFSRMTFAPPPRTASFATTSPTNPTPFHPNPIPFTLPSLASGTSRTTQITRLAPQTPPSTHSFLPPSSTYARSSSINASPKRLLRYPIFHRVSVRVSRN